MAVGVLLFHLKNPFLPLHMWVLGLTTNGQ